MRPSDLSVVVLAAGKGTRLQPLSLEHPKAMTPILGVPILARVIERFRNIGLRDFVVVKGPDAAGLDRLCADLGDEGLTVRVALQKERKGTAHALLQARDLVAGDFVLCSCDNLFPEEHLERLISDFVEHAPPAVLTLMRCTPEQLDRAAGVRLRGSEILEIHEKPGRADAARWQALSKFLYVFRRRILDDLDHLRPSPRGEIEIQDALLRMMGESDAPPRGVFADRCLHLTSVADLLTIQRDYLARQEPCSIHQRADVHAEAIVRDPVQIDAAACVAAGAELGPDVWVGEGATVAAGAVVRNSAVYPRAVVAAGETLDGEVRL